MSFAGRHSKPLVALDLGTTKFCVAVLRTDTVGQITVETCSVPADGMRRGMLADLERAKVALGNLVTAAEKQFGMDIESAVVGIAGSHLQGHLAKHTIKIPGIVRESDVHSLTTTAEGAYSSDTRELLHTVPLGYRLGHNERIDQPIGFSSATLTGEFFLIDADKFYMRDVVSICNAVGLQVKRLYSEPFASASVTVPDEYKELGVAVADIGGGTTDGIVFMAGRPQAAFTVNIGGKLMTSDLAIGLNIPADEAERVKVRFGLRPNDRERQEVRDLKGNIRIVGSADLAPILSARVHELAVHIAKALMPFKGQLGAGLLLTGGGAEVKGIEEFLQRKLNIPVTRAKPVLAPKHVRQEAQPTQDYRPHASKFATVLGLLNLELGRISDPRRKTKASLPRRYLGQFVNWLKELS